MYFQIGEAGKRNRWSVKVGAETLLGCCKERIEHHKTRVTFWEGELARAEEKLRSEGIHLQHYEVTGGRRTEAQLDASLAKRVSECEQRLKANRDAVSRFNAFAALLRVAGDGDVELNVDDVLYFNLEGADLQGDGEE